MVSGAPPKRLIELMPVIAQQAIEKKGDKHDFARTA
jgi:hypothetical protein